MTRSRIDIPDAEIRAFCQRHGIRRLSLFGSVLTDGFDDQSDVDLLVEFLPGSTPGLAFFGMQDELSEILKRPVDPHTPQFLSRHFRDEVIAMAEDLYVAA